MLQPHMGPTGIEMWLWGTISPEALVIPTYLNHHDTLDVGGGRVQPFRYHNTPVFRGGFGFCGRKHDKIACRVVYGGTQGSDNITS